jgi:hypothetical protein
MKAPKKHSVAVEGFPSVAVPLNPEDRRGVEDLMGFRLRMILWIPTVAYAGFLLLGGKSLASLSQVVFALFLGALLGFLLAAMFTMRQIRRQKRFARLHHC